MSLWLPLSHWMVHRDTHNSLEIYFCVYTGINLIDLVILFQYININYTHDLSAEKSEDSLDIGSSGKTSFTGSK